MKPPPHLAHVDDQAHPAFRAVRDAQVHRAASRTVLIIQRPLDLDEV